MLDISKMDKADVLAKLYNAAKPQGMGFLHYTPQDMTREEAQASLEETKPWGNYYDYHKGRVMKVRLSGDTLDPRLYDRDNGQGAAARALEGQGFTNIQLTGYSWFSCGKDDATCTGFVATGPSGNTVTGAVGCSYDIGCGKGCTIRTF